MKGVSAVIATILMLMITIALAALAYTYISGAFTQATGVVVQIDATATTCSGSAITVYVRNSGTEQTDASKISLSGTSSTGVPLGVSVVNGPCGLSSLKLPAGGGAVKCTTTLTGATQGNNRVVVSGPSNTVTGSVYCAG